MKKEKVNRIYQRLSSANWGVREKTKREAKGEGVPIFSFPLQEALSCQTRGSENSKGEEGEESNPGVRLSVENYTVDLKPSKKTEIEKSSRK